MQYQKIINFLYNTSTQPTKFRTNGVEINDNLCGTLSTGSQIKFKTSMLKPSLCDYSDAYMLVAETISVENIAAQGADAYNNTKKVVFKNYDPFTDCISEINNIQVDNAKNIDIVIPMYN